MIRVSELKQTEINIAFYEEERKTRQGRGTRSKRVVRYWRGQAEREVFEEGENEADTQRQRGKRGNTAKVIAGQVLLS